jgi:hypothetical protein
MNIENMPTASTIPARILIHNGRLVMNLNTNIDFETMDALDHFAKASSTNLV